MYTQLRVDAIGDETSRVLVLARSIKPPRRPTRFGSRAMSADRPVGEHDLPVSARCQQRDYRVQLATTCMAHLATATGQATFILYYVTTLHSRPLRRARCLADRR